MKRFLVALTAIMLLFVVIGCNADPEKPLKKVPFEKKYYSTVHHDSFTFTAKTGDFHYYFFNNAGNFYLLAFNDNDGKAWDEDRVPFMARRIKLNNEFREYCDSVERGLTFITREGHYGSDDDILYVDGTFDMLSEEMEYRSEFTGWTALISNKVYAGLASSFCLWNTEDEIEGIVPSHVPEEYRTGEKNLISTLSALGEWDSGSLPRMSDETKNRIFRK